MTSSGRAVDREDDGSLFGLRQVGVGWGADFFALNAFLLLMSLAIASLQLTVALFGFWGMVSLVFVVEQVVTAWKEEQPQGAPTGGVDPVVEIGYDVFQQGRISEELVRPA